MTRGGNSKRTDLVKPAALEPTCTLYVRVPVSLRNALVREANASGRTITAQLRCVLSERYDR